MRFIKKGYEYRQVYEKHRRVRGNCFTLLWQDYEEEEGVAFGLIVSSKVGNAVTRNRIKRRMRAYLHLIKGSFEKRGRGVIIALSEAAEADWKKTVADLSNILAVSGLYADV